ncbi:hypothetical protein D3C81_2025630 [compost metagenome]
MNLALIVGELKLDQSEHPGLLVIRVQDLYFSISLDITPGDLKLMKHTYFAVALEPGHEINVMLIPLEELLVTDVTSVKQIGSSRFPN